jgi:tryptophanyl-tRNA synthetase
MEAKTKVCTKCGEEKEVSEFHLDSRDKNKKRRVSACIICFRIMVNNSNSKKRRERREAGRKYYIENKQKVLNRQKKYIRDHKEKLKKYRHSYYEENKEKILFKTKNCQVKNRERYKNYAKISDRKSKLSLDDRYISRVFKLGSSILKQYPELIEAKRIHLQIKRELKKVS